MLLIFLINFIKTALLYTASYQTGDVGPTLVYCWANVVAYVDSNVKNNIAYNSRSRSK